MSDFLTDINKYKDNLWSSFASKSEVKAPAFEAQNVTVPMVETVQSKPVETSTFTFLQQQPTTASAQNSVFTTASSQPKSAEVVTAPQSVVKKAKTETMDEFFSRYYSKYETATDEQKEKFVEKYLKSLTTPEKQAKEFERLRRAGVKANEIKVLSRTIKILNAKNQKEAAESVCNRGTEELNKAGRIVVAQDYFLYDKSVQNEVAKILVNTKDAEVVNLAAAVAYKTDVSQQVDVTKTLFNSGFEQVQNTIALNEGKYDRVNQISIYETLMTSKFQSVLNTSASNIYTLYKDNQLAATKMTTATGNEEAINYAASNAYLCDKSVQSEIKSTLEESGYDSVKETLANSPQEPETAATEAEKQEAFEKASIEEKLEMASSVKGGSEESCIKDIVKNASNSEKLALITPNTSYSVLSAIIDSNPSLEVISKIKSIIGNLKDNDQKAIIDKLNSNFVSSLLDSKTTMFNMTLKKMVLKKMADKSEIKVAC